MLNLKNENLFQTKSFINGTFIKTHSNNTFHVINPFNGKQIAEVEDCGVDQLQMAIRAAQIAQQKWKELTGIERGKILRKWHDLILENMEDLARILTLEQGKPIKEARGEIAYGASFIEWFAEEAKRIYGDTIPGHQRNKRITVIKQAIGVVAAITPWNFPNAMITRKVGPALAVGCSVIIKPSELTPLSANALAYLSMKAGFPPGVFNVINTNDPVKIGKEICANPIIRKISFTGSTEVGKILYAQSAETVKRISLELGGNAPFIVFNDANIDDAVEGAIAAKYRNTGQTCVCANRIFAQADIYDEFVQKLQKSLGDLVVGDGLEDKTVIGPMIEEKAVQFVEALLTDAKEKGGKVLCGGERIGNKDSLLFEPTIITQAHPEMEIYSKEIFGPVAPVFKFESEEEVLTLANDTQYGLAAYFYGNDYSKIWRVAEGLEYGMVGINTGMISTTVAPFGGIKQSGMGREGSKYGIDEFVELKYLCWSI